MKIVAYLYSDPLLESPADPMVWGFEVDRVYQDLGGRQQLQQLLTDCQAEPTDYLLIQRLDTLGDSVEEVSDRLTQLESLGIEVIATEQPYNSSQLTSTNTPNIRVNLFKLIDEIQNYQRSRRIRQGHARNRLKVLPPPGKAPYGYRRGKDRYILDRSTAPVVKDFFEQFLLYGSLRGAVRYLEKKYSKKISVSTGWRWLTNPIYRGDLGYQNGEVISDTHSPILNREEAAQIDRLLRRNRRLPPRTASAPRSLAGLVICGECQSHMTVTSVTRPRTNKEYLYLRPINCPQHPKCRAIAYEKILQDTIKSICQELPHAVAGMNAPSLDGVKQAINSEITQKQEILIQLPGLTTTGVLDSETADLLAQAVSIPQFWNDLSEAERRFYFREFIRQIEVTRQDKEWQLKLIFIF